jgi:hypothetical protein
MAMSSGWNLDAELGPQRVRNDLLGVGVAERVGEPVLVLRRGGSLQGIHVVAHRHVLRVAEREVAETRATLGLGGLHLTEKGHERSHGALHCGRSRGDDTFHGWTLLWQLA